MIKIKLSNILGQNKMTRKELSELVDIRPNTIGDLYNENIKKIDVNQLNKLCKVFNCKVEDLLEYVKDEEKNDKI